MNRLMGSDIYYTNKPDDCLRLGDVVQGFVSSIASIKDPCFNRTHPEYKIEVAQPENCVVMSPCCSIGEGVVSLASLQPLRKSFAANPYFVEDLTRLNRPGRPFDHIPPSKFSSFDSIKQQEILERGIEFPFSDLFVFPGNDFFKEYDLDPKQNIRSKAYMIDFRKIYSVKCDAVKNPEQSILGTKILQLSETGRKELREKIANYFARVPDEDKAILLSSE